MFQLLIKELDVLRFIQIIRFLENPRFHLVQHRFREMTAKFSRQSSGAKELKIIFYRGANSWILDFDSHALARFGHGPMDLPKGSRCEWFGLEFAKDLFHRLAVRAFELGARQSR